MHPPAVHAEVLALAAGGLNDTAVARATGLPRSTVRTILRPVTAPVRREFCARCWRPTGAIRFTPGEYAELLGFYLGDGDIALLPRTARLRLHLDTRHRHVVATAARLLGSVLRDQTIGRQLRHEGRMVTLSAHSVHLPCLFPQHGPGKKHERSIRLEDWQLEHVRAAPWSLLRGLMWTDGCFFINRTGKYAYLSAEFSNLSPDIRRLFLDTCALVGVEGRETRRAVRIYRRASVRDLASFVGLKC